MTAVKKGANPDELISAAERFCVEERKSGRFKTPYVAQATTWLNQERWRDYALSVMSEAAKENTGMSDEAWRSAVEMFLKSPSSWPSGLGYRPDMPGCRVPPEILSEFGIARAA